MTREMLTVCTALGALVGPGSGRAAGQGEVTLEVGASQIGPAAGFEASDARFAMGGLRASVYALDGSGAFASVLGGSVLGDSVGGNFLSGVLAATVRDQWSTSWSGALDFKLLAFGVDEPFPYRTVAAEVAPSVRVRTPVASVEVEMIAGTGRSRIEQRIADDVDPLVFDEDLWHLGTTAEVLVGSRSVQAGVAAGTHDTSGDRYSSVGGRLVFAGGWGVIEIRADRWDTPLGWETTGGLTFAVPLGRAVSFRGFVGRSDPDPLTLAQPGSASGGGLLGVRLLSTDDDAGGDGLHEVLSFGADEARVRLAVRPGPDAQSVALLGDFTLWEPIVMRRDGDAWVVELDVPAGTHHFGFLVDDEWYVPDDAPDVVPDEWGRLSATLVIEGAGS